MIVGLEGLHMQFEVQKAYVRELWKFQMAHVRALWKFQNEQ